MAPDEGYLTTDDGTRLFYQKVGSGPQTVIFANGFYLLDDFQHLAAGRTLIFYDARNRGRSDTVTGNSKLQRGIHNDVDDLEAIRRHFGIAQVNVVGHSYMGLMVALYAMKYAAHTSRVLQIGSMPPNAAKQHPAYKDETLAEVFGKLGELHKERQSHEPREFCRKYWSLLRAIYVANPADADKIKWERCDLPNELNFMKYWSEHIFPSIQSINLSTQDFAKVTMPVLIIHGRQDRSAPYGGAEEWAMLLPDARLVTVENAAHAPWIESPELVFSSIETFLNGARV
jgi:proline iminopeptidase